MEIAALILGIVAFVISLFPFCGIIAFIPAIVGVILGIVALVKKNSKMSKAMPIVGIVLSGVSVMVIIFWFFLIGIGSYNVANKVTERIVEEVESYDYRYDNYPIYNMKEEAPVGNRIITVNSVVMSSGTNHNRPDNGKMFMIVDLSVKNSGNEDIYITPYAFKVVDSYENVSYKTSYNPQNTSERIQFTTLTPNETVTGTICFEVDDYDDNFTLIYDDGIKNNIVRINLDKISE